ncbi:MAG: LPS assembly protein LptD [Candidatus Paracaedibacteraceae bacterium]|nr:LPS assembly protein LptD [Candidatus Paracaedibacteraceae bacterium]
MVKIIFLLISCISLSFAKDIPVNLKADKIEYDAKGEILIATGHVYFSQKTDKGIRTLKANRVVHNAKQDTVVAFGTEREKVVCLDMTGDVIEADELTLTSDFKTGVIKTLTLFTKEKATIHAAEGRRKDSIIAVMEDADYTPCKFCSTKKPVWQLKATKVIHNKENKTIEYANARLEIKGFPVFYTPYFSHPDPTVKRKSGLLSPTFVQNNDLGYSVGMPVYYVVSDQKDMTVTPIMTTKQSGIIQAEYRERFRDGIFTIAGSYTKTKNLPPPGPLQSNGPRPAKPDRWNLALQSRVDISDNQRLKIDVKRASDMTYLQRYSTIRQSPFIQDNQSLRSNITWQHFSADGYADIQSMSFQTDAPKTTPLILPKASYHYQITAPEIGGTIAIEGGALALFRHQAVPGRYGSEMYRISNGVTWKRPWVSPYGQIITAQAQTRGDLYMMRRYYNSMETASASNRQLEHRHVRLFPQGSLDWQWPFQKRMDLTNWIIKPQAMIVSSPLNVNNRHIPNEDSLAFELDDTSMFLPNRFDGIDRVDAGTRAIAGVENELRFSQQRSIALFLGQSKRLDNQHLVRSGLGEDNATSDLLMRLKVKPASWFSSRYRMAVDPNLNTIRYSELGATLGKPIFKVDGAYVFLNKRATLNSASLISQLNMQVSSEVTENWRVSIGQIRNLKRTSGSASLATYFSATYDDECFTVDLGVYRSGYSDRDVRPETSFLVGISFKTLANLALSPAPKYPASMLTAGL